MNACFLVGVLVGKDKVFIEKVGKDRESQRKQKAAKMA